MKCGPHFPTLFRALLMRGMEVFSMRKYTKPVAKKVTQGTVLANVC